MVKKPHVVILGGGPAGLGAAYQVTKKNLASVTVIEQENDVGGIAGSFNICGINVDYGSHRLHPACDPEILRDLQMLLGNELMERPRHGRIRLRNRWIHFPLKPFDLASKLPFSFSISTAIDLARKNLGFTQKTFDTESFAGVLESGLGRTICREFYFPYVHKIWGLLPEEISPTQAHRRVSANSLKKMLQKILETDEGTRRLGEVALVPHSSPISQSGLLFYNILLDENASCHIALGRGLKFWLKNGEQMSDEEFSAAGGNNSIDHVDFMIGSSEMNVDGILENGNIEPIMRKGEWAFEV